MVELRVPDLDLPGVEMRVSAWHAKGGQRMAAGDRLVEITAGDVTVELDAPADGILREQCVRIDDLLAVGQVVARIAPLP